MTVHLSGCVIFDINNNILLLHRNKNGITQWELPGGKVEENEDPERAATREIEEELGVTVKLYKKLGQAHFIEGKVPYVYTWFQAEIMSGELSICEPELFDDLKNFPIEALASMKLSNNMKKLHSSILNSEVDFV